MDDEGLSVWWRKFGPWCASCMDFCGHGDGGLVSEDEDTSVEVSWFGAERGLCFCCSRMKSGMVLRILRCCFRFVVCRTS